MKSIYKQFKENIKTITDYYLLLVEETKSQRLVGSTNEWVLDNYYMISEQEKVLRVELKSRDFRRISADRLSMLESLLRDYLTVGDYKNNGFMSLSFMYGENHQSLKNVYPVG